MGLIKTGLKAAVFVKTAHVVHDRIERRQQAEWAAQGGSPGSAPGGPAGPQQAAAIAQPSILDQLTQLGDLRAAGVVTDTEFEAQKARILAG
ncbi:MAG TPA: SHOCT domain-containing protein [Actinomycetes bacterium]